MCYHPIQKVRSLGWKVGNRMMEYYDQLFAARIYRASKSISTKRNLVKKKCEEVDSTKVLGGHKSLQILQFELLSENETTVFVYKTFLR